MTLPELLLLKFPDADFRVDILLQDDGTGPYIKEWNLKAPLPTQKDLDAWSNEFDLQYRQKQTSDLRVSLYPSLQQQLDMQYWDTVNDTSVWKDTIAAIKLANPIPNE